MIPWIQVYSNLLTHPKTGKLVDALDLKHKDVEPECIAAGLLISLWTWAIQNAVTGDLSGMSNRSIAKAAGWRGNADKVADALRDAGFVDADNHLHDWEEYANLLMDIEEERKAKTRERVRKHRQKKTVCNVTDVTCNVTSVTSNAPTIHNITEHNNTVTIHHPHLEDDNAQNDAELGETFTAYLNKMPLSSGGADELKGFYKQFGKDVCLHALSIAVDNAALRWSYCRAILQGWASAKLTTLDQITAEESRRAAIKARGQAGKQFGLTGASCNEPDEVSTADLDRLVAQIGGMKS